MMMFLGLMMTMFSELMMTMFSEEDEEGVELSSSAPPASTGDRQRCSGFTRRESSSRSLIIDYFHSCYWAPASLSRLATVSCLLCLVDWETLTASKSRSFSLQHFADLPYQDDCTTLSFSCVCGSCRTYQYCLSLGLPYQACCTSSFFLQVETASRTRCP